MAITPTNLGRISSYYYLSHLTLRMFHERLDADCSLPDLIEILAVRIFLHLVNFSYGSAFFRCTDEPIKVMLDVHRGLCDNVVKRHLIL